MSDLFPDHPDYLPFPSAFRVARCLVCGKAIPLVAAAAVSIALCPAHDGHHEHVPHQDFGGLVYTTAVPISSSTSGNPFMPGVVDGNDVAIQNRKTSLKDWQSRFAAAPTELSWLFKSGSSSEDIK